MSQTQVEIYKLHPNTTYKFRVWAINKLGPGDYAEVMATTKDTLDNQGIYYSFYMYYSPPKEITHILCLFYFIQVHGSLTSTYGRIQSSPWILTLAVLVGSVGFTVLVLAFFMLQNRRICSRRKCLWPHLGPGHTHTHIFLKSLFFFSLPTQEGRMIHLTIWN